MAQRTPARAASLRGLYTRPDIWVGTPWTRSGPGGAITRRLTFPSTSSRRKSSKHTHRAKSKGLGNATAMPMVWRMAVCAHNREQRQRPTATRRVIRGFPPRTRDALSGDTDWEATCGAVHREPAPPRQSPDDRAHAHPPASARMTMHTQPLQLHTYTRRQKDRACRKFLPANRQPRRTDGRLNHESYTPFRPQRHVLRHHRHPLGPPARIGPLQEGRERRHRDQKHAV